jgi:hypothetical protein
VVQGLQSGTGGAEWCRGVQSSAERCRGCREVQVQRFPRCEEVLSGTEAERCKVDEVQIMTVQRC